MKVLLPLLSIVWICAAQTITITTAPATIPAGTVSQDITVSVTNAKAQVLTIGVEDANLAGMFFGQVNMANVNAAAKAVPFTLTVTFTPPLTPSTNYNWVATLADADAVNDLVAPNFNAQATPVPFMVLAAPTVAPTIPPTVLPTVNVLPTQTNPATVAPTTTTTGGTTTGGTTQQSQGTTMSSTITSPAAKGGIIGGAVAIVLVLVAAVVYRRRKAMIGETDRGSLAKADRQEMLSRQLSFLQSERGSVPNKGALPPTAP